MTQSDRANALRKGKLAHPTPDSKALLREKIAAILYEPEGEGALAITSLELAEVMSKDKLNALEALVKTHTNNLLDDLEKQAVYVTGTQPPKYTLPLEALQKKRESL